MRGERKKHKFVCGNNVRKGRVGPGHSKHQVFKSVWLPRLTANQFNLITKVSPDGKSYTLSGAEKSLSNVKVLRPRPSDPSPYSSVTRPDSREMRVVDKGLTLDMINDLYVSHARCLCQLADFEIKSETKWGLGWSWTFGCKRCNFISKRYKLYHEVPSKHCGRKAAEMNLGIQTGLYQTPLGNDQARLILACTGIPPPARSAMYKSGNKVGEKIVEIAERDMDEKLKQLKKKNEMLGLPSSHPINIQMDASYQSRGITSRHKMGQGASQVIGVACEDETDQHNVISYHMVNKLCWVGAWLRGEGYDVSCPNGHVGCTANKNPVEPLSERETGYKIGEKLAKHDLLVKYVTTDGDATSCAGLETALQNTLSPLWKTSRLADRIHRGQSLFRQGVKAEFSPEMFPAHTKTQKSDLQKMFANDIKERCHGIFQALFKKHNGDLNKISKCLPRIVDRVIKCYSGGCGEGCRWSVTLCKGGKKTSWWHKSVGLRAHNLEPGDLKLNQKDKVILKSLLGMVLSISALNEMKLNTTTNKCESVNRTISVSLPKNKTYSRNAKSRALSGLLRANNGIDMAVCTTLASLGAPLGAQSQSLKALQRIKQMSEYSIKHAKSVNQKKKRAWARCRNAIHYVKQKLNRPVKTDYRKNQLEPSLSGLAKQGCENLENPDPDQLGCSHW